MKNLLYLNHLYIFSIKVSHIQKDRRRMMAGYSQNSFFKSLVGAQNWVCRVRFICNFARGYGIPTIKLKKTYTKDLSLES